MEKFNLPDDFYFSTLIMKIKLLRGRVIVNSKVKDDNFLIEITLLMIYTNTHHLHFSISQLKIQVHT